MISDLIAGSSWLCINPAAKLTRAGDDGDLGKPVVPLCPVNIECLARPGTLHPCVPRASGLNLGYLD